MSAVWREDLFANANRVGIKGFILGWIMNPGFAVATWYRIMRWGHLRGGIVGKAAAVFAWRRMVKGYGCYIEPGVSIGPAVRFPHPVGIIIGAGTVIGAHATIYQHVTFGRRNADLESYPLLGDGGVVYAGATLIGGIRIGERAVIGAGAVVRRDVPDEGVVVAAASTLLQERMPAR